MSDAEKQEIVTKWAEDMQAQNIEPSAHTVAVKGRKADGREQTIVRVFLAFDPALPANVQDSFALGLSQVLADGI